MQADPDMLLAGYLAIVGGVALLESNGPGRGALAGRGLVPVGLAAAAAGSRSARSWRDGLLVIRADLGTEVVLTVCAVAGVPLAFSTVASRGVDPVGETGAYLPHENES